MAISMGRFYQNIINLVCSSSDAVFAILNGVFPHINPGNYLYGWELATGIQTLGLSQMDLAIRYMLVGLVMNFVGGWVTDFTTAYVVKQQRCYLE